MIYVYQLPIFVITLVHVIVFALSDTRGRILVMDSLERLLAIESIRQVKARYLNACDLKDSTALTGCFLPGEIHVDYGHVGQFSTREAFVELFDQAGNQPHILDMHQGGNAEIEILSVDRAEARWNFDYRNINTEDQTIMLASGLYDDEYQCLDGEWLISKSIVTYLSAIHFGYDDGRIGQLFAGQSVAGIVDYGDELFKP